jgi:hypothetical protein
MKPSALGNNLQKSSLVQGWLQEMLSVPEAAAVMAALPTAR